MYCRWSYGAVTLSKCNNQSKGVGVGSKDYFRLPRAVTHKGEKIEKARRETLETVAPIAKKIIFHCLCKG